MVAYDCTDDLLVRIRTLGSHQRADREYTQRVGYRKRSLGRILAAVERKLSGPRWLCVLMLMRPTWFTKASIIFAMRPGALSEYTHLLAKVRVYDILNGLVVILERYNGHYSGQTALRNTNA